MEIKIKDLTYDQKIFLITKITDFFGVGGYYIPQEILLPIKEYYYTVHTMFDLSTVVQDLNKEIQLDEKYIEIIEKAFKDYEIDWISGYEENTFNIIENFLYPSNDDEYNNEEEIDTELTTKALEMTFKEGMAYSLEGRLRLTKIYYQFMKYGKLKTETYKGFDKNIKNAIDEIYKIAKNID